MFGILYSLFMSIGVIGHNAKENYYESVRKDNARDTYDRTYFDKKGREILLDNNRWVTSDVVNGHRVLKDVEQCDIASHGHVFFNTKDDKNQYILPTDAIDFIIPHEVD